MLKLRDYQEECVNRVLVAYKENPSGCELLVLPTGAGKTVIFSHIIDALARAYGLMALVIAHRDELLIQAKDKYLHVKPEAIIGKVGGGIAEYGGEVTVCGIATISRSAHIKKLKALYGDGKGLIIVVDEAHHSAAAGYQTVLQALPQAFVLMVTATEDRLDGKKIIDKKPLYEAYIVDMIKAGCLCDIKAIAIKTEVDLDEIKTSMGDFDQKQLDLTVNTPERNMLIVKKWQEHANGKRTIAFCVTIAHAEALAYYFQDAGIPATVVTGDTPLEKRQELYTALRLGNILVLCNVNVLTEGFDEPSVGCIITARPTQSRALYVQCIGRGLRLFAGKIYCILLDITDNCTKHRLIPQSLRKAIGKELRDNETIIEAIEREEKEAAELAEKRVQVRKLKEKRLKDIHINLLEKLEWQELPGGGFVLTVGAEKHRIAIIPSKKATDTFDVWARLAPTYEAQKWAVCLSIEECQTLAEKKARLLYDGKKDWVDKNNPKRQEPITENQKKMLDWYKIPCGPGSGITTKGDASDAIDAHKAKIDAHKAKIDARKAATAARKAAKQQREEVSA